MRIWIDLVQRGISATDRPGSDAPFWQLTTSMLSSPRKYVLHRDLLGSLRNAPGDAAPAHPLAAAAAAFARGTLLQLRRRAVSRGGK